MLDGNPHLFINYNIDLLCTHAFHYTGLGLADNVNKKLCQVYFRLVCYDKEVMEEKADP